jgi:hypothetical protein
MLFLGFRSLFMSGVFERISSFNTLSYLCFITFPENISNNLHLIVSIMTMNVRLNNLVGGTFLKNAWSGNYIFLMSS